VFSIQGNAETATVPTSVGTCPDCAAPVLIDLYEFAQIIPGVNLYKTGECFALFCSTGHFSNPDSFEYKEEEWLRLYDLVSKWLIDAPLLFEL
jgi:hypothetical protein